MTEELSDVFLGWHDRVERGEDVDPEDVIRAERNDAHRLIEEFMIAANEAVADWLVERKRPAVFRVHAPPDPEKLRGFVRQGLTGTSTCTHLNDLLRSLADVAPLAREMRRADGTG